MSTDAALTADLARGAGELLLAVRDSADRYGPAELGRRGDAESHAALVRALSAARPRDAVLSEESPDDPARLEATRVWIVDPLDGTREFALPGRTDWAVHVALWEAGQGITSAAVSQPALGRLHTTLDSTSGAGETGRPVLLVSDTRPPGFAPGVAAGIGASVQPMGSAGAKAMAVLRGEADAYVHAGGQWEWDSAAPVGVVLAAGLHASRIDGTALEYNRPDPYLPDIVICRPGLAEPILALIARAR